MSNVLAIAGRFLVQVLTEVARHLLPAWLIGSVAAESHGSSRWASSRERGRLGRHAPANRMHGDGIVLGWLGHRVLQSPAEDNVILFGVQRSGKTSTVVVPTLLGWRGAVVATSTKEELLKLTAHHRASSGPVFVFAPLDRDQSWIHDLGLSPSTWNRSGSGRVVRRRGRARRPFHR